MPAVYSKTDKEIVASVGETFSIELDGNATTGYEWEPQLSDDTLRLVERRYQPAGTGVGAGGKEIFTFETVKSGRASVSFEYKRPWETEAVEKQDFQLRIEE
jgi:inhibitor of cysteine peptidase